MIHPRKTNVEPESDGSQTEPPLPGIPGVHEFPGMHSKKYTAYMHQHICTSTFQGYAKRLRMVNWHPLNRNHLVGTQQWNVQVGSFVPRKLKSQLLPSSHPQSLTFFLWVLWIFLPMDGRSMMELGFCSFVVNSVESSPLHEIFIHV